MNNNNQDTVIFADLLSDEVVYLCRRLDKSLYICTVAEDEHGFYEKNAKKRFNNRGSYFCSCSI